MKKLVLMLIMSLTFSLAWSQDYTFKVLLNKGENTFKPQDGQVMKIASGQQISDSGEIFTKDGAYLGLLHKSGKIIQLRGEGQYTINQLQQQVIEAKRNSRFDQYIPARLSENERNRVNKGTRAVGDEESITVYLPEVGDLYGNEGVICWDPGEEEAVYQVSILDIFGEELYSEQTPGNSLRVDFSNIDNDVGLYTVRVTNKDTGVESKDYKVKKINADENGDLAENIVAISEEVDLNSPLDLLILTNFYEKNELFLDAITTYESLLEEFSDYEEIKEYYEEFLLKNSLK